MSEKRVSCPVDVFCEAVRENASKGKQGVADALVAKGYDASYASVNARVKALEKKGVKFPAFGRAERKASAGRVTDVAALQAILDGKNAVQSTVSDEGVEDKGETQPEGGEATS